MVYQGCLEEEGEVQELIKASGEEDLESYFVARYAQKDSKKDSKND